MRSSSVRGVWRWMLSGRAPVLGTVLTVVLTFVVATVIVWIDHRATRTDQGPTLNIVSQPVWVPKVPSMMGYFDGDRYLPWADQIAFGGDDMGAGCEFILELVRETDCGGNVRMQLPDVRWERSEWISSGHDPNMFVPQPIPWCRLSAENSSGWSTVSCRQPWCVSMSSDGKDIRCLSSPPHPFRVFRTRRAVFAKLFYDDARERGLLGG